MHIVKIFYLIFRWLDIFIRWTSTYLLEYCSRLETVSQFERLNETTNIAFREIFRQKKIKKKNRKNEKYNNNLHASVVMRVNEGNDVKIKGHTHTSAKWKFCDIFHFERHECSVRKSGKFNSNKNKMRSKEIRWREETRLLFSSVLRFSFHVTLF